MPTQNYVLILGMVFLFTPPSKAAQIEQGKTVYLDYGCAVCHGPNADGKGLSVQKSDPPPTNLTRKNDYRFGSSREQMRLSILNGIKEENSVMPPFKHIDAVELNALLDFLTSIQDNQDVLNGAVDIINPWVRLLAPTLKNTAGFLTIKNKSTINSVLVGASSPVFDKVEIHEMKTIDGMMRMRPVGKVTVKPNEVLNFEENGLHLMLIGLKKPLMEKDEIVISLFFANGNQQTIKALVKRDE